MTIEKEPQSITDFTFEVFEKQYRFYKSANKENVANTQNVVKILGSLNI